MSGNGIETYEKLLGNLGVIFALRDEAQDLFLPLRELNAMSLFAVFADYFMFQISKE